MSDIPTADVVPSKQVQGQSSGTVETPTWRDPLRVKCSSDQEGVDAFLLNIEVNELSRINCITRKKAQDEVSAMETDARPAMLHQKSTVATCLPENIVDFSEMQSVRRYWILQLDFKRHCASQLKQAQLDNESAVQHRERYIFLRRGNEAQEILRQQRAHIFHEQHQLVEEIEA